MVAVPELPASYGAKVAGPRNWSQGQRDAFEERKARRKRARKARRRNRR